MAELPYMPVHLADEAEHTSELSNEELGAVVRIQRAIWKAGGMIDEARLVKLSRAGRRWGAIAAVVREKFMIEGGKVSCPIGLPAFHSARIKHAQAVAAGSQGGKARAQKCRTEGGLNASYDGTLKSHNPLEYQSPNPSTATIPLERRSSNQNQNPPIISSLTRSAKGLPTKEEFAQEIAWFKRPGGWSENRAVRRIETWLGNIESDANLLKMMILEAKRSGHTGPDFGGYVEQMVREEIGRIAPPLPRLFTPRKASG